MILLVVIFVLCFPPYVLSYRLSTRFSRGPAELMMSSESKVDRKELWKTISQLERKAINLLASAENDSESYDEAYALLAQSTSLKKKDPFIQLASSYSDALQDKNNAECDRLLAAMRLADVPPHIAGLVSKKQLATAPASADDDNGLPEEVDPGSTFSDTVTDKIRVKVNSFYDAEKSDPLNGKYMFWYKVGIYNEGSEPVQIVARMWEIDKCTGDTEVVRGAGIMSTQPIIPPGDVFTYQSVCPLKVYPSKGKRVLGSMSGAYTMCKGNMGQHNFTVKVGKFNLILPESVSTQPTQ